MKFFGLLFATFAAALFNMPTVFTGTVVERPYVRSMFSRAYNQISGRFTRNGAIDLTIEQKVKTKFEERVEQAMRRMFPSNRLGATAETVEREMRWFFSEFSTYLELVESEGVVEVAIGLLITDMEEASALLLLRRRLRGVKSKARKLEIMREANFIMTPAEEANHFAYVACVGQNPTTSRIQICQFQFQN